MSSLSTTTTRRTAIKAAASLGILCSATEAGLASERARAKGRLSQSVCKWCYRAMELEDLCGHAAKMGIVSVELLTQDQWPTLEKFGLTCAVGSGICPIPDGTNSVENHASIEANARDLIAAAKKSGVPNLIVFSGNRRGMSDEEAWENSAAVLNRIKTQAEDAGVTILMELLNSKVNHPDYHCDNTPWGVELMKRVESPYVKLLYDIYHMQIMEGDVIRMIRDNIDFIGHFHTGGNPGRNEIDDTQELNYKAISKAIADLGFDGYFAHEFIPKRDPMTSLREAVELCTV
jgi:hydroxypyruvate isomerase